MPGLTHRGRQIGRALGRVLATLGVLACSPSPGPGGELDAYTRSLAIVSGGAPDSAVFQPSVEAPPRRRARTIAIETKTVDLAGFLGLQRCSLGELIGERNSGLGRVMQPSRQLAYELEFLRRADACLERWRGAPVEDRARVDELLAVVEFKRASLPAVYWNAVWASAELESLLSTASRAAGPGELKGGGELLTALEALASWGEGPLGIEGASEGALGEEEIERVFATLHSSPPIGSTLAALELLRHHLDAGASRLEALAREQPGAELCRERGRALAGVFDRFYVGSVQPYLARVDRHAGSLLTALDRLYAATARGLEEPPGAVATYHRRVLSRDDPEGLWRRYRAANARHARAWQRVGERCGFAPGRDAGESSYVP